MTRVSGDSDGCEGRGELSESDRHRLLADRRRRVLLDVLADRDGPVELTDLAATVAAREDGTDDERVAIDLHHHHLPLLDDLGVVVYDPARNRILAVDWSRES